LVALIVSAICWVNPKLTRFVESDHFRTELERETAKGLHLQNAHYSAIHRTGTWTAETTDCQGENGHKAIKTLQARGIAAKFNPWGVFRRLWQIDQIRIQSAEVGIQTYTPKPEPSPAKPWFAIFLPTRVYLKRVESEPVDVTWSFREKPAGFFGTHLLVTPHGRDFEYQADRGAFRMRPFPEMRLRHTHILITKVLLTVYNLDLQSMTAPQGAIHVSGNAGTRDDRSVDCKIGFEEMPISEWLPRTWSEHISGGMSGAISWQGKNPKVEMSTGNASLRVNNGRIDKLPFLEKIAALTGEKDLERLELNECAATLQWQYPKIDITHLGLEQKGRFRIEGQALVDNKKLSGAIQLGVSRQLLNWLPNAGDVFPLERNGYLWTTVHLSGTINAPEQDLSPRIIQALKESPMAALGLLFRQLGQWLGEAFGGD
jgi:hypothetical protein